jgi:hypothetical protein
VFSCAPAFCDTIPKEPSNDRAAIPGGLSVPELQQQEMSQAHAIDQRNDQIANQGQVPNPVVQSRVSSPIAQLTAPVNNKKAAVDKPVKNKPITKKPDPSDKTGDDGRINIDIDKDKLTIKPPTTNNNAPGPTVTVPFSQPISKPLQEYYRVQFNSKYVLDELNKAFAELEKTKNYISVKYVRPGPAYSRTAGTKTGRNKLSFASSSKALAYKKTMNRAVIKFSRKLSATLKLSEIGASRIEIKDNGDINAVIIPPEKKK